MNMQRRRLHGANPRDALDQWLLGAAFGSGAVGIIALKSMSVGAFWSAMYSAVILLVYAAVAHRHKRAALEPEVIGDNCYYLGFLFTLTSLAVTLYQLAGTGGETDVLRDVIAGFGVALSSTIAGVFLRILMTQLRTDIVSRDRQARLELNDTARAFRLQLTESISQIKAFSTEAIQLAGETSSRIHASNEVFHEAHREQFSKSSERYQEVLNEILQGSSARMADGLNEGVRKVIEQLRGEIAAGLSNLRLVISETVKLQEVEVAAQRLRMKQVADEAKHSDDVMQRWSSTVHHLTIGISQNIEKVRTVSHHLSTCFAGAAEDIEESVKSARRAINLQRLDKAFDKPIAGLQSAASSLELLVNEVSTAIRQISVNAAQEGERIKVDAVLLTQRLNEAAGQAEATIKHLTDAASSTREQATLPLNSDSFKMSIESPASGADIHNISRYPYSAAVFTNLRVGSRVDAPPHEPYISGSEGGASNGEAGPGEGEAPHFPSIRADR